MATVSYAHTFEYGYALDGKLGPSLRFLATSIPQPQRAIELDATLDSGAERSLFNGRIGPALGIDVLGGPELSFSTMAGGVLAARLHPIRLTHADLGTFELEVAFSTAEVRRNVLGRDFFDLVQIGFREHHLRFFVTPSP